MPGGFGPVPRPPATTTVPKPPLTQWDGSYSTPASQAGPSLTSGERSNLVPLPVPSSGNSGSGNTVVNTPSLDTFATNIGSLVTPVSDAYNKLSNMASVEPGQFYDAYQLQDGVSGAPGSTTDMVSNYVGVLKDLSNGLKDIQTAAQAMSKKYTSIDDLNNMKVADLKNDLSTTQGDFSNMMDANGGGSSTTSSSSSSSGSGKSGSGSKS